MIERSEALAALEDLFQQAADAPEMNLDEVNKEISVARKERKEIHYEAYESTNR